MHMSARSRRRGVHVSMHVPTHMPAPMSARPRGRAARGHRQLRGGPGTKNQKKRMPWGFASARRESQPGTRLFFPFFSCFISLRRAEVGAGVGGACACARVARLFFLSGAHRRGSADCGARSLFFLQLLRSMIVIIAIRVMMVTT